MAVGLIVVRGRLEKVQDDEKIKSKSASLGKPMGVCQESLAYPLPHSLSGMQLTGQSPSGPTETDQRTHDPGLKVEPEWTAEWERNTKFQSLLVNLRAAGHNVHVVENPIGNKKQKRKRQEPTTTTYNSMTR